MKLAGCRHRPLNLDHDGFSETKDYMMVRMPAPEQDGSRAHTSYLQSYRLTLRRKEEGSRIQLSLNPSR
jgi:hypothetical protein